MPFGVCHLTIINCYATLLFQTIKGPDMPTLSAKQLDHAVKLLFMGDSGTGKTAGLLSLAQAGYNLRIADFDNGIDILSSLAHKCENSEEVMNRIHYLTFTDKFKATRGGEIIPSGEPKAYSRFVKAMSNWKDEGEETGLGNVSEWGPDDVLIIDSLTFLSNAVMRWHLFQVGRIASPYQQDWLVVQRKITQLLDLLYSDSVKCNVVINAHIRFIDIAEDQKQGYPETAGRSLPPQIPRFFNTVVQAKIMGSGTNTRRKIRVVPDSSIGLKNAAPHNLPNAELPLDTGLATIFKAIRS